MNKKKIYLIGTVTCLFFTACTLDTVPTDKYVEENFWKNSGQISAGLTACYSTMYNTYMYGPMLIFSETATPNAYNYGNNGGWRVIGNGTLNLSNSAMVNSKWGSCYQGIGRCNTFIENSSSFDMEEDELNEMVGEAKFLRALYYFDLTKNYGDAPLILEKPDVNTQSYLPRDPQEDIVVQILKDLDDAALSLPVNPSQKGRATKGAAYALKARVCLFFEKWDEAEKAADAVVALNKYSLYPDYRELFSLEHENNQEVIFDVQYQYPDITHSGDGLDLVLRQHNTIAPTLDLVRAYEWTDGKLYSENPDRDLYTDRDPRFYATIVYPGATYMGKKVGNTTFINTGYTYKKFAKYDEAAATMDDTNDINLILLRYADVLLMKAEARNELLAAPDQAVYDAINAVRGGQSVNMPQYNMATDNFTKEQMREKIRHERRIELAGEGVYYDDIRRWRIAENVMNAYVLKYDGSRVETRTFSSKNYLWPLPQQEIDDNPNLLPNNPGWETTSTE